MEHDGDQEVAEMQKLLSEAQRGYDTVLQYQYWYCVQKYSGAWRPRTEEL